jgi:hypothetical protein
VRAKPADRFYADFSTLRRNEKDRLPRQARDKTGGKLNQKGGALYKNEHFTKTGSGQT